MGTLINNGHVSAHFVDTRTPRDKELDEWRFKMRQAKANGNWKAYRDIKKHYDKLCSSYRRKNAS
jgi:hypothetical protein